MGLFSTTHRHSHDNSTHIRYPDTVKVQEYKAPTDESIRLMEEAHDKAIQNIIAKVKVENNLVNGECFCFEQPWNIHDVKLVFKFEINGKKFVVEKELSRRDLSWDGQNEVGVIQQTLKEYAKSLMLWYALRMFSSVAYEQITGKKVPEKFLK